MRPGIVLVLGISVQYCGVRCNTSHNSDTLHDSDVGDHGGGTGVLSQYTDLPYPPYTRKDEMKEREYYVKHTDCQGGVCHLVSANNTGQDPLVFSLEPELLNSLLYEVVRITARQY